MLPAMIVRRTLLCISALLAMGLAAAALPAWAACPAHYAQIQSLLPVDGATEVPLNGVVAFGTVPAFAPYDPVVTVTSAGGGAVSGGVISGPGGSWIFRPDSDLSPSTTYSVTILDQGSTGSPASSSFTTGPGGVDLQNPVLGGAPILTFDQYVDPTETAGCSTPGYWSLHVAWDAATDASPVIYAVQVDVIDLQPEFAPVPHKGVITSANQASVGVPQNSAITVTVYAVDEAGRQGHSPVSTIIAPIPPQHTHRGGGCSCDLGDTDAPAAATMLASISAAVALLVARRLSRK
jgi:hypothetical protein